MNQTLQPRDYLVYKLYNDQDVLLYVGFTKDWKQRRKDHKARQPWFGEVAHEELEVISDELSAKLREVALIFDASPRYNRIGKAEGNSYTAFFMSEYDRDEKRTGTFVSPGLGMKAAPVRAMRRVAIACGCKGVFCHLDCEDIGTCLRSSISDTNPFEIPVVGQWSNPTPPRSWLRQQEEAEQQRKRDEQQREVEWRASPEGQRYLATQAQEHEKRKGIATLGRESIREKGRNAAHDRLPRTPPYTTWLGKPNTFPNRLWLEGYDEIALTEGKPRE